MNCIIIDDMIDTAGTIVKAAEKIKEIGAEDIYIAAVHGVLSGPAKERLSNSPATEVVITDTIAVSKEQKFDKLNIVSVAPFLAKTIKVTMENKSISKEYELIIEEIKESIKKHG